MLRSTILALAAAAALGTILVATEASARGGFGRLQNDPEVATAPITNARYDTWRGCWSWSHAPGPHGWEWRRIYICASPYN